MMARTLDSTRRVSTALCEAGRGQAVVAGARLGGGNNRPGGLDDGRPPASQGHARERLPTGQPGVRPARRGPADGPGSGQRLGTVGLAGHRRGAGVAAVGVGQRGGQDHAVRRRLGDDGEQGPGRRRHLGHADRSGVQHRSDRVRRARRGGQLRTGAGSSSTRRTAASTAGTRPSARPARAVDRDRGRGAQRRERGLQGPGDRHGIGRAHLPVRRQLPLRAGRGLRRHVHPGRAARWAVRRSPDPGGLRAVQRAGAGRPAVRHLREAGRHPARRRRRPGSWFRRRLHQRRRLRQAARDAQASWTRRGGWRWPRKGSAASAVPCWSATSATDASTLSTPGPARTWASCATPHGQPIAIDGLWGLRFGNGNAAKTDELLFSAGPDDESHGLLGKIVASH